MKEYQNYVSEMTGNKKLFFTNIGEGKIMNTISEEDAYSILINNRNFLDDWKTFKGTVDIKAEIRKLGANRFIVDIEVSNDGKLYHKEGSVLTFETTGDVLEQSLGEVVEHIKRNSVLDLKYTGSRNHDEWRIVTRTIVTRLTKAGRYRKAVRKFETELTEFEDGTVWFYQGVGSKVSKRSTEVNQ